MPVGAPSRTSQAVALVRAELTRPHSRHGDGDAQLRLCAGMPPTYAGWLRPEITVRTTFFDAQVESAISRGVGQIVILGAGYDDRALRFRTPGVRFFEVDHPATQRDKTRRLRAIAADLGAVTLAAADFSVDDIAAVVGACGHDADSTSLFICEGLLVYLTQPTIVDLLRGLRTRATSDSTLAASLALHAAGGDSARVTAAANARRRAGRTEPWRTILPAAEHYALLATGGWLVETAVAATPPTTTPPKHSQLVTARPTAG